MFSTNNAAADPVCIKF